MQKTQEVEAGEGKQKHLQVLGKGKTYNTTRDKIPVAVADKLITDKKAKEVKADAK
jgi:hypothetical protein